MLQSQGNAHNKSGFDLFSVLEEPWSWSFCYKWFETDSYKANYKSVLFLSVNVHSDKAAETW